MQLKHLRLSLPAACLLLLAACSNEPYPIYEQNELIEACVQGIESGQTPVINNKSPEKNRKEAEKLCNYRFNEFTKEVSLSDYQRYKTHLYENYERAWGQKFVLKDIYDTLSENDQRVFRQISEIMLGLDTTHEKQ